MNYEDPHRVLASYVPRLVLAGGVDHGPPAVLPASSGQLGTVMFADLSGFTAMAEALSRVDRQGADRIAAVLNQALGALVQAVHGQGGDVVKFAGDAVLSVWLADPDPGGLERSAQAALRCAAEMMRTIERTRPAAEAAMSLRVGLSSGPFQVLHLGQGAGKRALLITDDPVDEATELCAFAAPGELRLGRTAAELLRDHMVGRPTATGQRFTGICVTRIQPGLAAVSVPERRPLPWQDSFAPYVPTTVLEQLRGRHGAWLAEVRSVSVLFVHLPGLVSGVAPARMNALWTTVEQQVVEEGGAVNKLSLDEKGSTVLAVFGLPPQAHEDDAARACRAALAIVERLGQGARVGVTTGRAFCGEVGSPDRREYTVIGDPVNTAARLMGKAGPGQVLVDAATARRGAAQVRFAELPPVKLKGKDKPVPVFRPLSAGPLVHAAADAPIVGREDVLEHLAAWPGAGQLSGRALLLAGAPGTGKSSLVRLAGARWAAEHRRVVQLDAENVERSSGLRAWAAPLSALFRGDGGADGGGDGGGIEALRQRVTEAAGAAGPMLPLIDDLLPIAVAPTAEAQTVDARDRPRLRQALLVDLFAAEARRTGLILVVEDAHLLDEEALGPALALGAGLARLDVIFTARPPPDAELGRFERLARLGLRVALRNLTPAQIAELLRGRLRVSGEPPVELVNVVHGRTGGNPLFACHLIDHLVESGTVRVVDGRIVVPARELERSASELPVTLEAMLLARIDRLSREALFTLKVASVIGARFDVETLLDIHPTAERRADLRADLQEFIEKQIALPIDAAGAHWRFQHALLRDAAYDILPTDQRRVLHRAAAQAAAARLGPEPDRAALERVASHHLQAGELVPAVRLLYAAAAAAAAQGRAVDVMGLVDRADSLRTSAKLPEEPQAMLDRGEALAAALLHRGAVERAAVTQREVLGALGEPTPSDGDGVWVELVGWVQGERRAADLAGHRLRASANLRMARIEDQRGARASAVHYALRALRLARDSRAMVVQARAAGVLSGVFASLGHLRLARRALAVGREAAAGEGDAVAMGLVAGLSAALADDASALRRSTAELEALTLRARRRGAAHTLDRLVGALSTVWALRGEPERALDVAAVIDAEDRAGPRGAPHEVWAEVARVHGHLRLGRPPAPEDTAAVAGAAAADAPAYARTLIFGCLAAVAWAQGRLQDSLNYVDLGLTAAANAPISELASLPSALALVRVGLGSALVGPASAERLRAAKALAAQVVRSVPVAAGQVYGMLAAYHGAAGHPLRARWYARQAAASDLRLAVPAAAPPLALGVAPSVPARPDERTDGQLGPMVMRATG